MPERSRCRAALLLLLALLLPGMALGHNVSESNANYLAGIDGPAPALFAYLGAKHMVTGVDHVLYLLGIVFLLWRPRQVVVLVSLFALGHSVSLIAGVLLGWQITPQAVDALIGLSVAYKAFENLDGFHTLFGWRPDLHLAVLLFGLAHGLGLATKLQAVYTGADGLLINLLAFNVGVEIGQLLALAALLALLALWRRHGGFARQAVLANTLLMACGFAFAGFHLVDLRLLTA